jgi:membrane protease YdiL (CAAX protease family)
MEIKKGRKHSLCEKNAVLAMILTVPLGVLTQMSGPTKGAVSALIVSALSLVLLIIYNMWFSPEFDGVFKAHVPVKEILMVSSAMTVLIIGCIIINAVYAGLVFKPSITFLCLALMAGINEETIFRAMLIPIGMRYLKGKNRALTTVIVSSVIFGPLHMTNILVGADPVMTLIQAFMATCGGFVLAGIYLRTGSVIPGIIAHAVYDFINFVTDPTINEEGIVVSDGGNVGVSYYVIILVVSVALLVAGCYLIRKTKQETIENIWQTKWSKKKL